MRNSDGPTKNLDTRISQDSPTKQISDVALTDSVEEQKRNVVDLLSY